MLRAFGHALEVSLFCAVIAVGVVGSIVATGVAGLYILGAAALAGIALWGWGKMERFLARRRSRG